MAHQLFCQVNQKCLQILLNVPSADGGTTPSHPSIPSHPLYTQEGVLSIFRQFHRKLMVVAMVFNISITPVPWSTREEGRRIGVSIT